MTTELKAGVIEVRRKKENIQSPSTASVIIQSGYLLNDENERVEAIFKNPTSGADMANLEVPPVVPLVFNLQNKIDAHNYKILKEKMKRYPIYSRILEIVDVGEKAEQEVAKKDKVVTIQAKVATMKEIEIVEICNYLQFQMYGKSVSELKKELYQYIEANPEIVASALEDKLLPIKAIVRDAINRKLIVKNDTGAYMREATKFIYGKNIENVVEYFNGNQEAISELMNHQESNIPTGVVTLKTVASHNMEELFENAKKAGVIVKDGKNYTYNEIPLGSNKEVCVEFLKNNPNIAQAIHDILNKK